LQRRLLTATTHCNYILQLHIATTYCNCVLQLLHFNFNSKLQLPTAPVTTLRTTYRVIPGQHLQLCLSDSSCNPQHLHTALAPDYPFALQLYSLTALQRSSCNVQRSTCRSCNQLLVQHPNPCYSRAFERRVLGELHTEPSPPASLGIRLRWPRDEPYEDILPRLVQSAR